MKFLVGMLLLVLAAPPGPDPYALLTPGEKSMLKPQIDRWVRDQAKHDWADMWEIQDQTAELKNELLLGHKDAPDMARPVYVEAMRETIGTDYPEIKAFSLREIRREKDGFWILGCGKLQRENWKQTSITDVHARVVNNKVVFGLPGGTPDPCRL